jgi:hypothetical protein
VSTVSARQRLNDLLNLADIHLLPQNARAADLVMPSKLTGMLASDGWRKMPRCVRGWAMPPESSPSRSLRAIRC